MELTERITSGVTQLTADDADAASEPASTRPAQRGFGLLVPPRSQASGVSDLPGDDRSLLDAVAAVAAETGGAVTCARRHLNPRPPPAWRREPEELQRKT
jgi:hypothetical protein